MAPIETVAIIGRGALGIMYANYDIEQAGRDYDAVRARVDALQLAVDMANQTASFEVTLP